mgnify:CR=1 FL=1
MPGGAARPFGNSPIRVVFGPFREFALSVHHAGVRRDRGLFEREADVLAALRCAYQTYGGGDLDHGGVLGCSGAGHFLQFEPGFVVRLGFVNACNQKTFRCRAIGSIVDVLCVPIVGGYSVGGGRFRGRAVLGKISR